LPSVDEPFPMAVLEAFAVGLPVVMTDRTGLSEIARERGAACVVDGSSESMAKAILKLVQDAHAWAEMSKAAAQLAASRFSIDHVANRLISLYRSM
jgi:glycosyltransferase involved in cell wall biosynthesis